MAMKLRMFTHVRTAVPLVLALLVVFSFAGPAPAANAAHHARFELSDGTVWDSITRLEWPRTLSPDAGAVTWTAAAGYIDQLNRDRYLGFDDWRLPAREELLSLTEYMKGAGFDGSSTGLSMTDGLRAIGLQGLTGAAYWTSSESRYDQGRAWAVDLSTGNAGVKDKALTCRVIAVRSAP